jgi:probable F420-dependent oxidoreductase
LPRHDGRFRFGLQANGAASCEEWVGLARKAESLGYSTLSMPDHFGDQFAPVPAMAAAAACTSLLRVGALVFDNDYKHPVVLAKEAATLDVLSGGRLELGLGAGWLASDYEQSGIPYDPPKVRIDRMLEGLKVIRGLMAEGSFSFEGQHYAVTGMQGYPKPVQRPHPPLLIGGGGKRILSIAAREADIVGITANASSGRVGPHMAPEITASSFAEKVTWVKQAAGPRFDDLELHANVFVFLPTDDRQAAAARVGEAMQLPAEDVLNVPLALIGTEAEMVDQLQWQRDEFGFSYRTVPSSAMDTFAPIVERLAGT